LEGYRKQETELNTSLRKEKRICDRMSAALIILRNGLEEMVNPSLNLSVSHKPLDKAISFRNTDWSMGLIQASEKEVVLLNEMQSAAAREEIKRQKDNEVRELGLELEYSNHSPNPNPNLIEYPNPSPNPNSNPNPNTNILLSG
jgi:hypothetical protein